MTKTSLLSISKLCSISKQLQVIYNFGITKITIPLHALNRECAVTLYV